MRNLMKISIGADPEVFAVKEGKLISAHGLCPGTKEQPFAVPGGAIQVDGMALEFNITPSYDEDEFVLTIDTVMDNLRLIAGVELRADPVATFEKEYFDAQPEEATERGCDPDFNAWTGRQNNPPKTDLPIWTGAGHVHIGFLSEGTPPDNHMEVCRDFSRQLDFFLGLPSLVYDPCTQRRGLYGSAGAFRPKPYGVEYRVLSNKWLASDGLKRWVFRNTVSAFESMGGERLADVYGDIQGIINTSNVEEARGICEDAGIEIPEEVCYVG